MISLRGELMNQLGTEKTALAVAIEQQELASCLPTLEGGDDALKILKDMGIVTRSMPGAAVTTYHEKRIAAIQMALNVMDAEA